MPIKEEDERFQAGGHEYTIRMAFSGDSGIWYEVSVDDQLLGNRESWPVRLGGRNYTQGELIAEKRAMLEDQASRGQEASGRPP